MTQLPNVHFHVTSHGATQTSPNPLFKGRWERPITAWCEADVTQPFVRRGFGASQHRMVQRRRHQTLCSKGVGSVPAPHGATQTSLNVSFKRTQTSPTSNISFKHNCYTPTHVMHASDKVPHTSNTQENSEKRSTVGKNAVGECLTVRRAGRDQHNPPSGGGISYINSFIYITFFDIENSFIYKAFFDTILALQCI